MDAQQQQTMTVQDVARILGVCRTTVYASIKRGQIPALRIGRRYLVPTAVLERLLATTSNPKT